MWTAHANVVSADSVFKTNDELTHASAPFFDMEDEYYVKADLWQLQSVALTLMDLLFGVNLRHDAIDFVPDFQATIGHYATESDRLLAQRKDTERFKKAAGKYKLGRLEN